MAIGRLLVKTKITCWTITERVRLSDYGGNDMTDIACNCRKCASKEQLFNSVMIVCSICGNKRCPHATDHNLECTNSNDPGQIGSWYE